MSRSETGGIQLLGCNLFTIEPVQQRPQIHVENPFEESYEDPHPRIADRRICRNAGSHPECPGGSETLLRYAMARDWADRAGRTRALAGVPSEPATFYLGAVNGGVWKTTDAGATWHSIWDDQPSGSIGAIAVSLSDPNTVYVGSGEGLQRPDLSTGDGVYKSTDAGKTWTHLEGLRDGQQIGELPSTRTTRIGSSLRSRVTRLGRMRSAACIALSMAAKLSSAFFL